MDTISFLVTVDKLNPHAPCKLKKTDTIEKLMERVSEGLARLLGVQMSVIPIRDYRITFQIRQSLQKILEG